MKIKPLFPFILVILALSMSFFCCAQEETGKGEVLASINDYKLMLKEFEDQLVSELELEKDFKLTKEAKKEFLDQLIRKEILIQEAKKLDLDRKEKFINAIQRYWEATLIKNLMELKGEELSQRAYVSQEEIEARYNEMKESQGNLPPLEKIQEKIAEKLMEQKKREKLMEWIDNLRKNAKVEIDQKLLFKN